jgi:hypothetical protein
MSGFPHAENVPGSDVGASKVTCHSTRTCARPATQTTHTNPRRAVQTDRRASLPDRYTWRVSTQLFPGPVLVRARA